jgi:hypothetical protein
VKQHRRYSNKKALGVTLGVVAVAAVAGSAFAASISTTGGSAGQGATVTSGYSAGTVTYSGGWTNTATNASSDLVTQLQFVLRTTADGTGTSTVTSANTNVWAQIVTSSGGFGNWASCTVGTSPVAGTVTCGLTGSQQRNMSLTTGVSIVANSK